MWAYYDDSYLASNLPGGDYYTDITGLVDEAAAGESRLALTLLNCLIEVWSIVFLLFVYP